MNARCETCGRVGALLHERTDPRTFKTIRARLCRSCGTARGYVRCTFLRGSALLGWH